MVKQAYTMRSLFALSLMSFIKPLPDTGGFKQWRRQSVTLFIFLVCRQHRQSSLNLYSAEGATVSHDATISC